MPLLGAGLRSATYPGLLWNGARLHRAGTAYVDALVLVALAAGVGGGPEADLERGVQVGLDVAAALDDRHGSTEDIGHPTTRVVASAACAATVGGTDRDGLSEVLDLAATLMVVMPPVGGDEVQEGLWAGHCLAAGWLATQALATGLVAVPDALARTVATVTGQDATVFLERLS